MVMRPGSALPQGGLVRWDPAGGGGPGPDLGPDPDQSLKLAHTFTPLTLGIPLIINSLY